MWRAGSAGDTIRAQEKYGQPFSFRNYAKLIFSANKIPDSDDKTHAYYKRWLILPFEKVFDRKELKDTKLIDRLTTPQELSGLLNLALIALEQLHKDGGFKDVSVEKIRKEYDENSDTVKAFLDDRCVIELTAPECYTLTTNVYNEYLIFCKDKGQRPLEMMHVKCAHTCVLNSSKRESTREATITKEPVTETKTVEVPVTHEEISVERRPASGGTRAADRPVQSKTETKVPLKQEEVQVTKQPYVKEEVSVRKKPVTETRTVTDKVTSEKVKVKGADTEEEEET